MYVEVSDSKCSFVGKINSDFYTVSAIGRVSVWVSKMLQGWWMGTDREKVDLFSDTWVCVCVCEDHMSRLQGLSVHISLNDKLQTVFAASEGEDTASEDELKLSSFSWSSFLSLLLSLSQAHTHTHTLPYTHNPAVCDAESPWQPYK